MRMMRPKSRDLRRTAPRGLIAIAATAATVQLLGPLLKWLTGRGSCLDATKALRIAQRSGNLPSRVTLIECGYFMHC
jgi:hypothetical protein